MLTTKVPAVFAALLILLAAITILSTDLTTGKNLYGGEYNTLERSAAFSKQGDWLSVYSSNARSGKKPPLQYWLTAIHLKLGMPELVSLRMWPFIFLIGLLVVTALISFHLSNDNPWVIPASILLLTSSSILVRLGRSGMLDAGVAFFLMSALLSFLYAKERSKYWILCGLFIGLGALQKAPVALLFVLFIMLVLRFKQDSYYRWQLLRNNRYFNRGLYLGLALVLFWPVLQTFRMGMGFSETAFEEMVMRFSPVGQARKGRDSFMLFDWLWDDIHMLSLVAGLCVVGILVAKKWRDNNLVFALAVLVLLISVFLFFATGRMHTRYLAFLTPLLIVLVIKVVDDISPKKPMIFGFAVLMLALSLGNVQDSIDHINAKDNFTVYQERAALIDEYRQDHERVFLDTSLIHKGAYGYFGESKLPFYGQNLVKGRKFDRLRRYLGKRPRLLLVPIIGIGTNEYRDQLISLLGPLEIVVEKGDIFIWRYRPALVN